VRPLLRGLSQLDLGPTATALELLEAVYRNPAQELHTRIRCAMACLPFQSPKLLATAIIQEGDFATLLDQRLKRLQEMKLIEANGAKHDQPEPINQPGPAAEPAPPIDLPSPNPLTRIYDNRRWPRRF